MPAPAHELRSSLLRHRLGLVLWLSQLPIFTDSSTNPPAIVSTTVATFSHGCAVAPERVHFFLTPSSLALSTAQLLAIKSEAPSPPHDIY